MHLQAWYNAKHGENAALFGETVDGTVERNGCDFNLLRFWWFGASLRGCSLGLVASGLVAPFALRQQAAFSLPCLGVGLWLRARLLLRRRALRSSLATPRRFAPLRRRSITEGGRGAPAVSRPEADCKLRVGRAGRRRPRCQPQYVQAFQRFRIAPPRLTSNLLWKQAVLGLCYNVRRKE